MEGIARWAIGVLGPEDYPGVLQAARVGADWAWTALYRELSPAVLRYARSRYCDDPEDVVGEVFVQVVRKLPDFTGDGSGFRAWVFSIAHNKIVDQLKRSPRQATLLSDDLAAGIAASTGETETEVLRRFSDAEVRHVLERLSPKQRDVVLLRVIAGLSIEETAIATGQSPGSVKSLQHRALASIRKEICGKAVSK